VDCAPHRAALLNARSATFGGAETATIVAGALLVSDPVSIPVPPLGGLATSV